jgi:nucleotide-binding universal stress UspA family protein
MHDVIVGVDRSESAHRAAVVAAELAAAYATNLHVVMCVERTRGGEVGVSSEKFRPDFLAEAETFLTDLVRSLGHDATTHSVAVGDPAETLCEEAQRLDARTIVVGNRRVQGMARALGSVATDVIRKAPCDVLVANTMG